MDYSIPMDISKKIGGHLMNHPLVLHHFPYENGQVCGFLDAAA